MEPGMNERHIAGWKMNVSRSCINAVRLSVRQLGSPVLCRRYAYNLWRTTSSRGISLEVEHHPRPLSALKTDLRNLVGVPTAQRVAESNAAGSLKCIDVDNERGMLAITWANGETADFHAVWLRHNCQCPSCITSSNQKTIYPSMLNPNVTITSTNISGLLRDYTTILVVPVLLLVSFAHVLLNDYYNNNYIIYGNTRSMSYAYI